MPEFSRVIRYKNQVASCLTPQKTITEQDFIVLKGLGQGTYAKVFLAMEKQTGFLVTLKKINKSLFSDNKCMDQILTEIKIQTYLSHPNIVKMYGFYVSSEHVTLVLEFMEEGSLFDKLKKVKTLTEKETSRRAN
jgi:serine/threonine protein kinase